MMSTNISTNRPRHLEVIPRMLHKKLVREVNCLRKQEFIAENFLERFLAMSIAGAEPTYHFLRAQPGPANVIQVVPITNTVSELMPEALLALGNVIVVTGRIEIADKDAGQAAHQTLDELNAVLICLCSRFCVTDH